MCFLIRANGEVHSSRPVVLKTLMYQYHLKSLLKHRALSLTPRVSDSVSLEWDQGMCISNHPQVVLLLLWGLLFENH